MRRPALFLLMLTLLTCVPGIWWGLPVAVKEDVLAPWELDSVAPLLPLTEAYYKFTRTGNDWVRYPLFHYMVLSAAYAPYIGTQYLLGNLHPTTTYPYGMADVVAMCRHLTLICRVVSLAMALATIWLAWKTAYAMFDNERVAIWAGVLIAILAPFTFYAKMSNFDVPYMFWAFAALYAYVRLLQTQQLKYYVILGVTTALTIGTKDQAYGFFVLPPLAIVYGLARHRAGGRPTARDLGAALVSREILSGVAAFAIAFTIANNLLFAWDGFVRHVRVGAEGGGDQPWRMYPTTPWGEMMLAGWLTRLTFEMLGAGSMVLILLGIIWTLRRGQMIALSVVLFPVSYLIFFLGIVGFSYPRFMMAPVMIFLLFAAAAIDRLLQVRGTWRIPTAALVVVSLGWQALLTADLNYGLIMDSRNAAEAWFQQHAPRGATIESPIVRENLLPHLSGDYKVTLHGAGEVTPDASALTGEALRARGSDYILLVSLGMSADHDTWTDPTLVAYRDALLSGRFGYRVVATFDTPHLTPYRMLTGTIPQVTILARDGLHAPQPGSQP